MLKSLSSIVYGWNWIKLAQDRDQMKAVVVTATDIHIHNKSYRNMTRDYHS
jgi:hypothetical protein